MNVVMITHPLNWTSYVEHNGSFLAVLAMAASAFLFLFNATLVLYEGGRFLDKVYTRFRLEAGHNSPLKRFARRTVIVSLIFLWVAFMSYFPIRYVF